MLKILCIVVANPAHLVEDNVWLYEPTCRMDISLKKSVEWALWTARRKAIHERVFQNPQSIHSFIEKYIQELEMIENKPAVTQGISIGGSTSQRPKAPWRVMLKYTWMPEFARDRVDPLQRFVVTGTVIFLGVLPWS